MSLTLGVAYTGQVPKLWDATIETHRAAVRDATVDATAALVHEHGMASVTMSQIAKETGIGRATLYKYFSDVEAIMIAWHQRHIDAHLRQLAEVRDQASDPRERLQTVLAAYALISFEHHHDSELAATLHQGEHVARAQQHLVDFVKGLLAEAAAPGHIRDDVSPAELTRYCLHALTAASSLPSKVAVNRLVEVTLAGLRRPTDA